MKLLRLKLRAPLQSWGERSRWDSRDTAAVPTKSGIIGLLGCCLGLPRGSEQVEELDRVLHLAVRTDAPGRVMTDFHTVQAPKGEKMLSAAGKPARETILTPKAYLQDAAFTVLLWGDEPSLERCREALLHPVWTAYLGRRSCVPSVPLLPEMVEAGSVEEAFLLDSVEPRAVEIELLPGDVLRPEERRFERPDGILDPCRNRYYRRAVRASVLSGRE